MTLLLQLPDPDLFLASGCDCLAISRAASKVDRQFGKILERGREFPSIQPALPSRFAAQLLCGPITDPVETNLPFLLRRLGLVLRRHLPIENYFMNHSPEMLVFAIVSRDPTVSNASFLLLVPVAVHAILRQKRLTDSWNKSLERASDAWEKKVQREKTLAILDAWLVPNRRTA